jgi:putative DNA primase/helicase
MTLDDFLARFSEVRQERDGFVVPCPSHADSNPSLRVAVGDSGAVILRCRAGCETRSVLEAIGLSFADLRGIDVSRINVRATSRDVPPPADAVASLSVEIDGWALLLASEAGAQAREYARNRFGVEGDLVQRLRLGFAENLKGGPRLVVPFLDERGVAMGYQARALAKESSVRWLGPASPAGASWAKVGFFPGESGWEEVIVTEGPGDALTACALGYDSIAVRGSGLATNSSVVEEIARLVGDRVVVVAGDGDSAGRMFSTSLVSGLMSRNVRAKMLPVPDGLDLSDWRSRDGAKEVVRAILSMKEATRADVARSEWDVDRYALTDLGAAEYLRDFITAAGSMVRHSPEAGFYLLDGGIWKMDRLDRVRTFAQRVAKKTNEIARALALDAKETGLSNDEAKARKEASAEFGVFAKRCQSTNGIEAMLKELRAVDGVATSLEDFDRHHSLLAARNGVVDLRTGELLPHDPGLLLTRRIELDYVPDAPCPRWLSFLDEVFPNEPDLPGFVQRLIGYGITGETREQSFAVLWGTGANGKSVFTDTLTEVFRSITVTTPFATFEDKGAGSIPNDIAALKGSRLVMASEGEHGRPMAEAMLKRVTGRDMISARFMRKEFFEFRPTFLLLLATNYRPNFRGQDDGLWRRVKLIPWTRYFEPDERDHRLGHRLLTEATGIFAWAVRGAVEWYERGLDDPSIVKSETKNYRETSDPLAGFLPGVYVFDEEAGDKKHVVGANFYNEYRDWSREEGLKDSEVWGRRRFFSAMEERGIPKKKKTVGIVFYGIRRARPGDDVDDVRAEVPVRADLSSKTLSSPSNGPSLSDLYGGS